MKFTTKENDAIVVNVKSNKHSVDLVVAGHSVAFLSTDSGRLCRYVLETNAAIFLRSLGLDISQDNKINIR